MGEGSSEQLVIFLVMTDLVNNGIHNARSFRIDGTIHYKHQKENQLFKLFIQTVNDFLHRICTASLYVILDVLSSLVVCFYFVLHFCDGFYAYPVTSMGHFFMQLIPRR